MKKPGKFIIKIFFYVNMIVHTRLYLIKGWITACQIYIQLTGFDSAGFYLSSVKLRFFGKDMGVLFKDFQGCGL